MEKSSHILLDVDVNKKIGQETTENKSLANVWKHFEKGAEKGTAVCKICKVTLKSDGGSTSGLITHAKTKHGINVLKRKVGNGSG